MIIFNVFTYLKIKSKWETEFRNVEFGNDLKISQSL